MGRIVQPERDFSAIFKDFDKRLKNLEAHGPFSGAQLITSLGFAANNSNTYFTNSTTPVVVPGVSVTTIRSTGLTALVMVQSIGGCGVINKAAYGQLFIDGVLAGGASASGASFIWDGATTGLQNNMGWQVIALGAGSHTFDFRTFVTSGGSWDNWGTQIEVFAMG